MAGAEALKPVALLLGSVGVLLTTTSMLYNGGYIFRDEKFADKDPAVLLILSNASAQASSILEAANLQIQELLAKHSPADVLEAAGDVQSEGENRTVGVLQPGDLSVVPRAVPGEFVYHDCFPDAGSEQHPLSEQTCRQRHCDWDPSVPAGQPWCFLSRTQAVRYSVTSQRDLGATLEVDLQRHGSAAYGGDFLRPHFQLRYLSDDVVRFTFDDAGAQPQRFRVPADLNLPTGGTPTGAQYRVRVYPDTSSFAFQIIRKATGTVVFDTGVGGLILSDQYLQVATDLPSKNVYGLGEHLHPSFRQPFDVHPHAYPAFSRDWAPEQGKPLYGVQPFYTCVEDSEGNTHGIFMLNSNAQEYTFSNRPMMTWRTIGGVLDFFIFLGPSPEAVVQQYTRLVGLPVMPPYWGLGFQMCKWGYNNLANMQRAVSETLSYGIPLDVQYADIDHMDQKKDFTVDNTNFRGLNEYWQSLRAGGMRTVIILDPCLSKINGYEPYEKMKQIHGNIQWPSGATPSAEYIDTDRSVLGNVWPDPKVVFPDFFKNATRQAWRDLIVKHHSTLAFDGLWIDMNEPSNFETNLPRPNNWAGVAGNPLQCPSNKWDDPPYRPLASTTFDSSSRAARLSDKTVCMNSIQGNNGEYLHYNVHSLYGWSQTRITFEAARAATGERSMVITRSNFPGSGKYAGHWLGDNFSNWEQLRLSIIGLLEYNLFGIPWVGADICGFNDDTTPELCLRWMQLGAFYPFSRNHNSQDRNDQHPGHFGPQFAQASREIMETRYWLLPYLYTLFHQVHTQGGTVVRPLHHVFPTDSHTLGIDGQFMWGPALLIAPILAQGQATLQFYLPEERWYDFFDDTVLMGPQTISEPISYYSKPRVLMRGGHIFPLQRPANNTVHSRRNPMTLKVMLSNQDSYGGIANGTLFWDDGKSMDTFENGNYFHSTFNAELGSLRMHIDHNNGVPEMGNLFLDTIQIHGVSGVGAVTVTSNNQPFSNFRYEFIEDTQLLKIHLVHLPMSRDFVVQWSGSGGGSTFLYPASSSPAYVDCFPDAVSAQGGFSQDACQSRHCVYDSSVPRGYPWCYYPKSGGLRYSLTTQSNTAVGFRVQMQRFGLGPFGKDFANPVLDVQLLSNDLLRFTFDDSGAHPPRYRVPIALNLPTGTADNTQYLFHITDESRMAFQIVRKSTGKAIFDTGVGGLVLSDQFLQLATKLPSHNVFGLGENVHDSFKHQFGKYWANWARDQPPSDLVQNLYGVQPFYTCVEDAAGNTHGVLLFNSNAQEYALSDLDVPMLTWRTIGGVLDVYVFLGPTPEAVVQQFTQLVGRPVMPPYWGLGFQLCQYGYNNVANMQKAITETRQHNIPLDVQYADIDHMDERMDFTVDPIGFSGLNDYWQSLRNGGMRTVIILDPALISNVTGYQPYLRIRDAHGYIQWPSDVTPPGDSVDSSRAMLGYVWPKGKVAFPDFFKNVTRQIWKALIVEHHQRLVFDGLWIDMNEPANFGTNEEKTFNWPDDARPYWTLKCAYNQLDDPPYRPLAAYAWDSQLHRARLSDKTLCLNAVQGNNLEYRHYDVHNLYGHSETPITLEAARAATGERSMVITRSTFPSSGHFAGHWLGDNSASWTDMRRSIIGMLEFNLFGIPYVGADICGFMGDTTHELCLRWMQLGAFYPFSRNHNAIGQKEQHPGVFGTDFGTAAREILEVRYWLLPYLYTLFHQAHTLGNTVVRPLHHEFPRDSRALGIDQQFMWGPALLISPILSQGQTTLNYYLPASRWYDFFTGAKLEGPSTENVAVTYYSKPMLHMRAGYILPTQRPANNTAHSRLNPFTVRVTLDSHGSAAGTLFWDDGQSVDTFENGNYYLANFNCASNQLTMTIQHNQGVAGLTSLYFEAVYIYGMEAVSRVTVTAGGSPQGSFSQNYLPTEKVLRLTNLHLALQQTFTVQWTH